MPVVSTRSTSSTARTTSTELGYGARGDAVSTMQQQLTAKGFGTAVDGKFGPDTLKQLKAFQHAQGLPVTARLDTATAAALTSSPAAPSTPAAPTTPSSTPTAPRADAQTTTDARRRAMTNPNMAISAGYVAAPSMEQVAAGTHRLRVGQQGPAVAELQARLNADGANLTADGKFGAKTETALKKWQASRDVTDTGIYGPTTHAAMQAHAPATRAPSTDATTGPTEVANTRGMTEAQRYDYYSQLAEQNGGQVKTGANQKNIVGLRTPTDADVNGGNGRYDDKFAMFWKDAQGNKRCTEYAGNTDPSARYRGRMGEDANGDGRLDQGRLPKGYFEFTTGHSTNLGRVLRPVADYRVERDTNNDGVFGNDNGRTSGGGNSMLFHAGGSTITGSAGCQTMTPAEYARFWRDVNSGGSGGRIGYTLIEVGG